MKIFKMFLFTLACVVCSGVFIACNSCSSNNKESDLTYPVVGLNVETIQDLDVHWMYFNYGDDWQWMECCIDMKNFINETDTCDVLAVANIFKVLNIDSATGNINPIAVLIAHTADTTVYEIKSGLWVGDDPMNDYIPFNVNFTQAWNKMMETNCIKPHSKHCVLRKEVGPKPNMDPIYIFGNQDLQVYVMSNTGEVNTHNPVFPDGVEYNFNSFVENYDGVIYGPKNTRIGCPLGEWP